MTRLVVDQSTRTKLHELREFLELCDESGNVLGYLTPAVNQDRYLKSQSPHSEEELRQREQEAESFSTSEVLDRLEKL